MLQSVPRLHFVHGFVTAHRRLLSWQRTLGGIGTDKVTPKKKTYTQKVPERGMQEEGRSKRASWG